MIFGGGFMNKIKIISDSTCDLSPELIQQLDLEILPLVVSIGDTSYFDLKEITTAELYQKISETGIMPKTAAVSPAAFEDVFKKYVDEGYDVIYCGIGSTLSATYQNACIAASSLTNVYCIDSLNLSSGIGLILLKINKLKEEGKSAAEIKEYVEKHVVPNVRSQFAINTFEYLHKGGRCSGMTRIIGTALMIKPVIAVRDGKMQVIKKPLGKLKKAINTIFEDAVAEKANIDTDFIMVTHSQNKEMAEYFLPKVREAFPEVENVYETQAGCVISSHCGKGTLGILYIMKG